MKVEPCDDLKKFFLDRLSKKYSNPRPSIHVSDLIFCLKESYFKKINPKPVTPVQMGYFIDGSRRHVVLEELSGQPYEVKTEKYDVKGHIDVLVENGSLVPVEFKSTRASGLPDHYFLQLGFYACMLDVSQGILIIQRLMAKEDPWEFHSVKWSEEEMLNLDYELYSRANLLKTALEKRDPSLLPKIDGNMKWKCRNCRYADLCGKS